MLRRVAVSCLILAGVLSGCGAPSTTDAPASTPAVTAGPAGSGHQKAVPGTSGLPTVAVSDLPPEAQQTYEVILAGGPYPYPQDGQIFGNREKRLPWRDYGWYREYTVETPGSPDRGARRFVVSEDRLFFYTDDHYGTFQEVIP